MLRILYEFIGTFREEKKRDSVSFVKKNPVRLYGKGTSIVQNLPGHHLVCSLREQSKQYSLLGAAEVGALQDSGAL